MKLTVEASIRIDKKRTIWISGHAEDGVTDENAQSVVKSLAQAVTGQAMRAEKAYYQRPASAADVLRRAGTGIDAKDRPKRPEDPATMRAFGED